MEDCLPSLNGLDGWVVGPKVSNSKGAGKEEYIVEQ